MLDIISITIFFIFLPIAILLYITILGSNIDKSEYEQRFEDAEQMKYLEEYSKKKKNKQKQKICKKQICTFERFLSK